MAIDAKYGRSLDRFGGFDRRRIRLNAHDFLFQRSFLQKQFYRISIALAHLGSVGAGECRGFLANEWLGKFEDIAIEFIDFHGNIAGHLKVLVLIFAGLIVLMPVFLFLRSFLAAGILHLALILVGGARKPFETTFRVLCYSSGSTSAFQLVPICGPWFFLAASFVYSVIGLKEAHRTELWRPILAIFLIFFVCCGAVFGLFATAAWFGYSAMHLAK